MDKGIAVNPRFAVGVFAGGHELAQAHKELTENGFVASDLCVMALRNVVAGFLGVGSRPSGKGGVPSEGEAAALRDLMSTLRPNGTFCVSGPIHVSEGAICAYVAQHGDNTAKTGWFSSVMSAWIARRAAQYLEDRLGEGKILVWVQTGNRTESRREHLACDILLRHASESVRVLDFTPLR